MGKRCGIRPRQRTGNEPAATRQSSAGDAPTENCVGPKKRAGRFCRHISGRNRLIWSNSCARQRLTRPFAHGERRPLSGSLQMPRKNTVCVIHTTEVCPGHCLGEAQICCYEAEQAGKVRLEQTGFFSCFCVFLAVLYQNPGSRFPRAGVL